MAADKPRWTEPPLGGGKAAVRMGSVRFSDPRLARDAGVLRAPSAPGASGAAVATQRRGAAAVRVHRQNGAVPPRGRAQPAGAAASAGVQQTIGTGCACSAHGACGCAAVCAAADRCADPGRGHGVVRCGASSAIERQRPWQCGQRSRSMPATRCMNAATESCAIGFGADIASAARACARHRVLCAGASSP